MPVRQALVTLPCALFWTARAMADSIEEAAIVSRWSFGWTCTSQV